MLILTIAVGQAILEPKKAVPLIRKILWNLVNLKDTYAWRVRIQRSRRASERELLLAMHPGLKRYQPRDRFNLRRMLDIVFKHSRRHHLAKPAFASW